MKLRSTFYRIKVLRRPAILQKTINSRNNSQTLNLDTELLPESTITTTIKDGSKLDPTRNTMKMACLILALSEASDLR